MYILTITSVHVCSQHKCMPASWQHFRLLPLPFMDAVEVNATFMWYPFQDHILNNEKEYTRIKYGSHSKRPILLCIVGHLLNTNAEFDPKMFDDDIAASYGFIVILTT